jgi:hypothetical protein
MVTDLELRFLEYNVYIVMLLTHAVPVIGLYRNYMALMLRH